MSDAETMRIALPLATMGLIGLFGPVAIVLGSRGMVSRFYMALQVCMVGVFGTASIGVFWGAVFSLFDSQLIHAAQTVSWDVGGLLTLGWFISAAALGFTFTITHIAYSAAQWLYLLIREQLDKFLDRRVARDAVLRRAQYARDR